MPDRETITVEAWLADRPEIEIVSRDRGGGYGQAVAKALPEAIQLADRWHLMENASQAFRDAVRRSMTPIRRALGAGSVDPALLTCAERLKYDGFLRRKEANRTIQALANQSVPIKQIVLRTGCSRQTVRRILRGERDDVFRGRASSLEPWLVQLDDAWTTGRRNGAELWRRLRDVGFGGGLRVVTEWATRRRRAEADANGGPRKCPSAWKIAVLLTERRDRLSRQDAITVAILERAAPSIAIARRLLDRFHTMIRRRAPTELACWLDEAARGPLAAFASPPSSGAPRRRRLGSTPFPHDILMPAAPSPSRSLMRLLPDPAACRPPAGRENDMTDLVMVALGAGGFALLGAYAAFCARL